MLFVMFNGYDFVTQPKHVSSPPKEGLNGTLNIYTLCKKRIKRYFPLITVFILNTSFFAGKTLDSYYVFLL